MTTGQRIKQRRRDIGLSAERLAEILGVSPATIYRYENGDIEKVPGERLGPIASALHTTPAYLMGWENDTASEEPFPSLRGNMLRIKQLRESRGLNMREASRILNMPYTTYVNYEKGLREPTSEILIQLADYFETTVDYLVGRDHIPAHPKIPIEKPAPAYSYEEAELIRKYRCLDDRGRSAVLNVLNHEYESQAGENATSSAKEA